MVDNLNPTSQFHPYQRPDATPHSERMPGGLSGLLRKVGIDEKRVPLSGGLNRARDFARMHPGRVLGGMAALVIGAGLMRRRSMRHMQTA